MSLKHLTEDMSEEERKLTELRNASLVREAVNEIVQSIQSVVGNTKDVEFKKKCLGIPDADDYDEFQYKTRRKLMKLLRRRYKGTQLEISESKSQNELLVMPHSLYTPMITDKQSSQTSICTPMRKRSRRKLSTRPLNDAPAKEESNGVEKSYTESEKLEKHSESTKQNMSYKASSSVPCRVDMSLLSDFINGIDDGLNMWLEDSSHTGHICSHKVLEKDSICSPSPPVIDDVNLTVISPIKQSNETSASQFNDCNVSSSNREVLKVLKRCSNFDRCSIEEMSISLLPAEYREVFQDEFTKSSNGRQVSKIGINSNQPNDDFILPNCHLECPDKKMMNSNFTANIKASDSRILCVASDQDTNFQRVPGNAEFFEGGNSPGDSFWHRNISQEGGNWDLKDPFDLSTTDLFSVCKESLWEDAIENRDGCGSSNTVC